MTISLYGIEHWDSAAVAQIHSQGQAGINILNVSPNPVITTTITGLPDFIYLDSTVATTVTVSVANSGQAPLILDPGTVLSGTYASEFALINFDGGIPYTIFPGNALDIEILWTPVATAGTRDVQLTLDHNDPFASADPLVLDLFPVVVDRAVITNTINSDLVLYYQFEQTSGNVVADVSGSTNQNDGSVVGRDLSSATRVGLIGKRIQ